MGTLTPSVSQGRAVRLAGTWRAFDDAMDPKVGGVYSHSNQKCSATWAYEIASLLRLMDDLQRGKCIVCRQATGSDFVAGTPVYVTDYDDTKDAYIVAKASSSAAASLAQFVIPADLATATNGIAVACALVEDLDTSAFGDEGDLVYLSNTAGEFAAASGDVAQRIGRVIAKDATAGSIQFDLPGLLGSRDAVATLADVDLTGLADGDAILWNDTTKRWTASTPVTTLDGLTDVDLSGIADGDMLVYSSGTGLWTPTPPTDTDEKVLADGTDATPGYLDAKVDDSSIEVDATSHVLRIKANGVTLAMLAQASAQGVLLGRRTAAAGNFEEVTPDGSTIELLAGGSLQVKNGGITYAKIQNISATDKLLGRSSAGAGSAEEIACTAAGRALLDDTDATAQRVTLGFGLQEAHTAADNLTDADTWTLHTNEGATSEVELTLPAAAAQKGPFPFYCADADGIKIRAGSGDTIRIGASASSAAGYVKSIAIGSWLWLVAINDTEWVAINEGGTWTIDA